MFSRTSRNSEVRAARLTDRVAAGIVSRLSQRADEGMTTAEYAVGTLAAAGCGGILYTIIKSDQFLQIVKALVFRAFKLG